MTPSPCISYSCAVMQTGWNDDNLTSNPLSLHFSKGKRNFDIRQWPHLSIASLAQVPRVPLEVVSDASTGRPPPNIRPYQWTDFMNKKLLRWDHRLQMENILCHRHPQHPPHTHRQCGMAPIVMNPIRVHYGRHPVAILASTDRKGSHTRGCFAAFTPQMRMHSLHLLIHRCFQSVYSSIICQWSLPL